jgi:arylsulfatase A-like enzyme
LKPTLTLLIALLLAALASLHAADAPAKKPNILVILTDDLGFSDIGCYGSEIETPNLDRLAANGVRFSQFYNTAKCHSSRVSLLTGRWCRQAGNTGMSRTVTLPEVLAPAGYFTAMTGKWHLNDEPTDFGFQRYFGHLSGMTNYYTGNKYFRLNGKPWTVPAQGFYTTVANVDHALNFIGEARAEKKPWFLYLAFNRWRPTTKSISDAMTRAGTPCGPHGWQNKSNSVFSDATSSLRHGRTTFPHGRL